MVIYLYIILKENLLRKKIVQIVKYIIVGFILCFCILLLLILGIWTTLQIKGSISFTPTSNISITLKGLSFYPDISLKKIYIQLPNYNTALELNNFQVKFLTWKLQNYHLNIEECKININSKPKGKEKDTKPTTTLSYNKEKKDYNTYFKYLPQKLVIKKLIFSDSISGKSLSLTGAQLTTDKEKKCLFLNAPNTRLEIFYRQQTKEIPGVINITCQSLQELYEIDTLIQFAPHILISGKLNVDKSIQKISLDNICLYSDELAANYISEGAYSFLSFPIHWKEIEMKNITGSFHYQRMLWTPETINGDISVHSLTVEEKGKTWLDFTSTLHIHSDFLDNEQSTVITLNTDEEPKWKIMWKYTPANQNTELKLVSESPLHSSLIQKTSPYSYDTFMLSQIAPFSVEYSFLLNGVFPNMEGEVQGKCVSPKFETITLNSKFHIAPDINNKTKLNWNGDVNYLSHPIHFSTEFIPLGLYKVKINTEKFPIKYFETWAPSFLKNTFVNSVGDCNIDMQGTSLNETQLLFAGKLFPENEDIEFPPISPSEFNFQGTIKNLQMVSGTLQFASENSMDFELQPCNLSLSPLSLEGKIKTKIYLSTISSDFLPFYLPGKIDFTGNLNWDGKQKIQIQGAGTGEGIGIAGYTLPEGINLCVNGNVIIDFSKYKVEIEQLQTGIQNCSLGNIQKCSFEFPSNDKKFLLNIENASITGNLANLHNIGIGSESNGTFSLVVDKFEYSDHRLNSGSIKWDFDIQKLNLPTWRIQIENFLSEGYEQNIAETTFPIHINADNIIFNKIPLQQIESNFYLSLFPFGMKLENISGNLWKGNFNFEGNIQKKDNLLLGNITGSFNELDLSQFTEEIKPPWIQISGIADGSFDFDVNLMTGQMIDGDFNLACPKGLTINRDVLLRLILYLQNVSIVEKQLEKLLGKEDPKPFTNGELTIGFENNQATVSLLLTTPNINLAPIFYINADWKSLWSLLTTPSNVQIEIK